MASEKIEMIADVLAEAGAAHHAAYLETDGEDPEWPLWYADHVIGDLRRILEKPTLTISRVVWALVAGDESYRRGLQSESWHHHYAERFVIDL